MIDIYQINQSTHEQFMEMTDGIFEQSPWIAEKAEIEKPFSSIQQLYEEMVAVVERSSFEKKLALIKAHPNLGDRVAMSKESIQEQKGAGLQDLTPVEYAQFMSMNQRYIKKFGFPFILAVRGKNKEEIYQTLETRIHHSKEFEIQTALSEIYKIAQLRFMERFQSDFT